MDQPDSIGKEATQGCDYQEVRTIGRQVGGQTQIQSKILTSDISGYWDKVYAFILCAFLSF